MGRGWTVGTDVPECKAVGWIDVCWLESRAFWYHGGHRLWRTRTHDAGSHDIEAPSEYGGTKVKADSSSAFVFIRFMLLIYSRSSSIAHVKRSSGSAARVPMRCF